MRLYLSSFLNVKVWLLLAAVDLTFLGKIFEKYIFSDVGYLKWLMIAMALDLITGITKVWVTQGWEKITSRGLRDTVSKCIQYGAFLIITHLITHFEVNGQVLNSAFDWINKVAYEFLLLIETKSVYENICKINPELDFIKFLFEKIYNTYFKNKDKEE